MAGIKKSPCCQPPVNTGVDNDAFEESRIDNQLSGVNNSHVVKEKRLHSLTPAREAIGLAGMNYRQLCNCEEDGMKCACRTRSAPPNKQNVRLESWGRCKCITLGVFTGLVCVWVVVYLTLDLTGVV